MRIRLKVWQNTSAVTHELKTIDFEKFFKIEQFYGEQEQRADLPQKETTELSDNFITKKAKPLVRLRPKVTI